VTEIRYLIPAGAYWAVWDDVNAVLAFMSDAAVIENARENERELGDEFGVAPLPDDPTPEQAWEYVDELWSGDLGGRMWRVRVPDGATWVALRDDEDEPAPDGPEPTFGFGEPPPAEGFWAEPGY
jgi:hypothetical protein